MNRTVADYHLSDLSLCTEFQACPNRAPPLRLPPARAGHQQAYGCFNPCAPPLLHKPLTIQADTISRTRFAPLLDSASLQYLTAEPSFSPSPGQQSPGRCVVPSTPAAAARTQAQPIVRAEAALASADDQTPGSAGDTEVTYTAPPLPATAGLAAGRTVPDLKRPTAGPDDDAPQSPAPAAAPPGGAAATAGRQAAAVPSSTSLLQLPGSEDGPFSALDSLLPSLPDPPVPSDSHLALLADLLNLPYKSVQHMALICPEAAALDPATAKAHWQQLLQLVPLDRRRLAAAVARHPWLLLQPQVVVPGRLLQMVKVLQLPKSILKPGSPRLPPTTKLSFVLADPEAAVARVALLARLLGVKLAVAQRVVLAAARLLLLPERVLLSVVEALEQVCQCSFQQLSPHVVHHPHLLLLSPEALYARAAMLQEQLRLSEEGVAVALKRYPAALLAPEGRVSGVVLVLVEAMQCSREEAQELLLQVLEVLLRAPGDLASCLRLLVATFNLTPEALVQVLQFEPYILLEPSGDLALRMTRFRKLSMAGQTWRADFRRLMSRPANVARAIGLQNWRLERLAYLRATGRDAGISLKDALVLSPAEFARMYPRFPEWLKARGKPLGPAGTKGGQAAQQKQQGVRSRRQQSVLGR